MLTPTLVDQYVRQHPYGMAASSADQLRYTWAAYSRYCGGSAVLCCERANAWIDHLRDTRRHDTVRTQRGNLLTIWRWAYEERLTDEPPLRVRRLRPVHRSPEAWTLDELRQLLSAAEQLPRRSLYWSSLIRTAYDTALRLGDLLSLTAREILASPIRVRMGKTGRMIACSVRAETRERLERHLDGAAPGAIVWPLWGRREAFYRAFRQLVVRAAIRPGTFRWIRRTAITQLERISPGAGTRLAGHAARSTTEQWYLDVSQLLAPPLPPW